MKRIQAIVIVSLLSGFVLSCSTTPNGQLQADGNQSELSSCCESDDKHVEGCSTSENSTVGCTPSSCRGAKTKFGEAEVIKDLRLSLIDLKSALENYEYVNFSSRSYDIHGIIGETDEESIQIIVNEIEIMEDEFAKQLDTHFPTFDLPTDKAKQIAYLNHRIENLKEQL